MRGWTAGRPWTTCWSTSTCPTSTLEDQEEYDTVGGLIYHRIGGIPKAGDVVQVGDDLTLTVESTDGRRVEKVLAVSARTPEDEGAEPLT